jgi:hypothetical protein
MSLHQTAKTLQSHGRGEDSVLIHMTPKEVQGLQSLALAHGGSLTINPSTGLPEAGFLSSILPALVGGALTFFSGGALTPLMAAGLVGGGTALATGDLRKGLGAGLGAFGGGGLGAGFLGAGAGAASTAAATGLQAAPGAGLSLAQTAGTAGTGLAGTGLQAGAGTGLTLAQGTAGTGLQAGVGAGTQLAAPAAASPGVAFADLPWQERAAQGFSAAVENPMAVIDGMGGAKKAVQYGMAAMSPAMSEMAEVAAPEAPLPEDSERFMYHLTGHQRRDPEEGYTGAYSGERTHFTDPTLSRINLAGGGTPEDKFKNTGASSEAFEYLMGRSQASARTLQAQSTRAAQAAYVPPNTSTPAAPAAAAAAVATRSPEPSIYSDPWGHIQWQQEQRRLDRQESRPPIGILDFSTGPRAGSGDGASPIYSYDPNTGGLTQVNRPVAAPPTPPRRSVAAAPIDYNTSGFSKGGIADLAKGGFVVPADVVSMLGEGSTNAGLRTLQARYGSAVKPIQGPGTGQSDSIPTSIEGRHPARVADGEAYIPPAVIAKHGGAKKFYDMLDRVRTASQGHTEQQRRINPKKVLA